MGRFTVEFFGGGELPDNRIVETGERALKVAIALLTELDALQHGDRLTVTEG